MRAMFAAYGCLDGQENDALLRKYQQSEESHKQAIQVHLRNAMQEKSDLESSLASLNHDQQARSQEFQKQLLQLHAGCSPVVQTSSDRSDMSDELLTKDLTSPLDLANVKELVERLRHRVLQDGAVIKKLKFELDMECGHVNILRSENQKLRRMTVELQASAEQEEECIANKLIKNIHDLKKEKGELLLKVEQEEEMITNTLQKKLAQLQKEKVEMEIALEQEQEFIVNRLQKQLENLRMQQASTATTPRKLSHASHSPSASLMDFPPSPGVVEVLRAEINALKKKIDEMETEYEEGANTCSDLYSKLREEVVGLRSKLNFPTEDIDRHYPIVLPVLVPKRSRSVTSLSGGDRSRSASASSASVRRSPSETSVGPHDLRWDRRSSRSVSSTRASINGAGPV
ncbi:hypothetical protein BC832DRAFT_160469 [Gaertneriomyces semiglobifer]|nr:hypothetical protein BC832DRAFT_160469 [Gaertneriomyces semiglobifer]